ncbi:MAG: hypothetical protein EZS28_005969 [Streblomastix strix]|uniref:ABC transporter domain-containing protein n=1 Tax=Streblomastix strix TaxID=222440 RepID=A0A5J4WUM5_9EUKA|nr:MAG: hypothetical protein EZS28_005969 [Streblomastix strix]
MTMKKPRGPVDNTLKAVQDRTICPLGGYRAGWKREREARISERIMTQSDPREGQAPNPERLGPQAPLCPNEQVSSHYLQDVIHKLHGFQTTQFVRKSHLEMNIIKRNSIKQFIVCTLETELQAFAAGDMIANGEKGGKLSDGQKARTQLVRAYYSDRDIYILDDPLSAVDAHVERLQFLEKTDTIILLSEGRIKNQDVLKFTDQVYASFLRKEQFRHGAELHIAYAFFVQDYRLAMQIQLLADLQKSCEYFPGWATYWIVLQIDEIS